MKVAIKLLQKGSPETKKTIQRDKAPNPKRTISHRAIAIAIAIATIIVLKKIRTTIEETTRTTNHITTKRTATLTRT